MTDPTPTKERLAQRLRSLGLFDLEDRARKGEFSDFESEHATPKVQLVFALRSRGDEAIKLAIEVQNGDWDDTDEEAEAWFNREGKDLLK